MKPLISILFILIFLGGIAQSQNITERQRHLGTLACLEAQGDLPRLADAINTSLDSGITVSELKETFSHLYAYAGFPRSLNALGSLARVIHERQQNGQPVPEGKEWTRPTIWSDASASMQAGTDLQTRLAGQPFNLMFCPQADYYLKSHLFGDIFASRILSPADREIVTIGALMGIRGAEPQLEAHRRGAVNLGVSADAVAELCLYLVESGFSQQGFAADATAGPWPQGEPNTAYAQYFIGQSFLSPIHSANLGQGQQSAMPFTNVTFQPRCRNNWHVHHGFRQILVCVSGRGWYQEWGKDPIALQPGMVIEVPEGVKHWHGAQRDSWFQHLSAPISTAGHQSTEWLDPVEDTYYNRLK